MEGTIDLYDPNPEQSGGLIRPFELLSSGSSPLEWFEFGIKISVNVGVYVKVSHETMVPKPLVSKFSQLHLSTCRLASTPDSFKSQFGNMNTLCHSVFWSSRCVDGKMVVWDFLFGLTR